MFATLRNEAKSDGIAETKESRSGVDSRPTGANYKERKLSIVVSGSSRP